MMKVKTRARPVEYGNTVWRGKMNIQTSEDTD